MSIQVLSTSFRLTAKASQIRVVLKDGSIHKIPVRVPYSSFLSPESRIIARRRLAGIMVWAIGTWVMNYPVHTYAMMIHRLSTQGTTEIFDWANVLSEYLTPAQRHIMEDFKVSILSLLDVGVTEEQLVNHFLVCTRRVDYHSLRELSGVGHEEE